MVYLVSSFDKSNNIGGNGALVVFFSSLFRLRQSFVLTGCLFIVLVVGVD